VGVKLFETIFISGVWWWWEWKGVLCRGNAGQFYDSKSCKRGLHDDFAGSPAPLHLCCVCALSAFTKAVASQTSPIPKFSPCCQTRLFLATGGSSGGERLGGAGLMEKQQPWASCCLILSRAGLLSPF